MPEDARRDQTAWIIVAAFTIALAAGLLTATAAPQDDHYLYQGFLQTLAAGRPNFAIPGFHGTDWLGAIVYLINGSSIAQIQGLMLAALLLPLLGYLAGRALYKDVWSGILLSGIVTMMPFVSFVLLRGWTGPGYWMLMLLTVIGAARRRWWTAIPFAFAVLTKPFAVALFPLVAVLSGKPTESGWRKLDPRRWFSKDDRVAPWFKTAVAAGAIVGGYLVLQYLQAGRIYVGAHADVAAGSVIQNPVRVLLNLAHSLQILFSVHNYYFPDPALTGPGNMMHTSPVLVFLGLFGLLAPSKYFRDKRLAKALLAGAVLAIVMNALLDHMDHFYMEAGVFLLILAAIPVLRAHPLWIPIALATLHFQWFYFWLQYRGGFALTPFFWATPLLVDLCYALWAGYSWSRERSAP